MLTPLPFALHATNGCAPHAELSLSLAGAFHDLEPAAVDERVERISAQLAEPSSGEPIDELYALADLMRGTDFPRAERGADVAALMIDRGLARGRAHPLIRAVVAVEVGRRHGFDVGVVSNGAQHCVGHQQLGEPLLLRADSGSVVDAHALPEVLQWRCAHETCGLLLEELEQCWLKWGRVDEALQAAELRLCLPFDDDGSRGARIRLEQVRARLN